MTYKLDLVSSIILLFIYFKKNLYLVCMGNKFYYLGGGFISEDDLEKLLVPSNIYDDMTAEDFYIKWKRFNLPLDRLKKAVIDFEEEELFEFCAELMKLIREKQLIIN